MDTVKCRTEPTDGAKYTRLTVENIHAILERAAADSVGENGEAVR